MPPIDTSNGNSTSGWTSRTTFRLTFTFAVPPIDFEGRLKRAYRAATKRRHPDAGGDHEAMTEVNRAYAARDLAHLEALAGDR